MRWLQIDDFFLDKVYGLRYIRRRYLRFGLWRSYLDRMPLQAEPLGYQKAIRSNGFSHFPKTFVPYIEHVLCASVRGCSTGHSGETNAPAYGRFSRQRAGSRSRWGVFFSSLYGYVLVPISNHKKALGISDITAEPGMIQTRFEKGSRVSNENKN